MTGKAVSSGEREIILNIFKHFKNENSSLKKKCNHNIDFQSYSAMEYVISPSKIRPNKNLTIWIKFDLGVIRHMMHQFYARDKSLAKIYFSSAEVSSKI